MSKKTVKIISIIIVAIMIALVFGCCYQCQADSIISNPNSYKPSDTDPGKVYVTAVSNVLGAIQMIGIIIAAVVMAILGVKYIMASPEGKADYKKAAIPYLIGAVLLISGTTIVKVLYENFSK